MSKTKFPHRYLAIIEVQSPEKLDRREVCQHLRAHLSSFRTHGVAGRLCRVTVKDDRIIRERQEALLSRYRQRVDSELPRIPRVTPGCRRTKYEAVEGVVEQIDNPTGKFGSLKGKR